MTAMVAVLLLVEPGVTRAEGVRGAISFTTGS